MIALERVRTKTAIVKSFRGDKPVERLVDLMSKRRALLQAGKEPKLKVASRWAVTKKQLLRETQGKCAYCETNFEAAAFGDVEHYRPKSIYWWLAYVYDNYLASCAICNQQFKSDAFEIDGGAMTGPEITANTTDAEIETLAKEAIPDPLDQPAVSAFIADHHAEGALLLNPYLDDPDTFFGWEVLAGAKEVELIPNPAEPRAIAVVDACNRLYGLNRPQLRRRRFKQWRNYRFTVRVLEDPGSDAELRDEAREMLDLLVAADSEYAAMVRFFERARLSQ